MQRLQLAGATESIGVSLSVTVPMRQSDRRTSQLATKNPFIR